MNVFFVLYTAFYCLIITPLLVIMSIWNKKIRDGLLSRIKQYAILKEFAKNRTNAPVILFHSSSVGEWEQAIPIIRELKQANPSLQIVASFFSPSGVKHAKKDGVDLSVYLPLDIYWISKKFLRYINPTVWIISKYDVWPMSALAAHHLKIPMVLASAELASNSLRHKLIFAGFNRLYYRYISRIFTVSEEYKQRFSRIYPFPEKISVSGDARYDHIISRADSIKKEKSLTLFQNSLPLTFIAGSIWPADEKRLLPAILHLYEKYPQVQFILVPHEIDEEHIEEIEEFFFEESIACECYSRFLKNRKSDCRIVIVDSVGILARLYKTTDIAYIGGAFTTGVHNVAEPAVFGNPVVYGPRHINSHEAVELIKQGAGFMVKKPKQYIEIFEKLIEDEEFRKSSGNKGRDFIIANRGAAQTIANYILKEHL